MNREAEWSTSQTGYTAPPPLLAL